METHVVYCSACDREVRVVYTHEPEESAGGREVDPTGVCADYCGHACTGTMCSLFERPPAEMLARLRQSGLAPEA